MKKAASIFANLASPFIIGLVITLATAVLAFLYYTQRSELKRTSDGNNPVMAFLQKADQWSYDLRLHARGIRPGSENVGLLVVDEKSVATVGRWPWPREVTGRAIENAVKHGAKVIAFDMVFSEPSDKPAERLLKTINEHHELPTSTIEKLKVELAKLDSDQVFSNILSSVADNVVLGSVYEQPLDPAVYPAYLNACLNFIHQQSQAHKLWDKEEFLISVVDAHELYVPYMLSESYKEHLKMIEAAVRQNNPTPKNRTEVVELEQSILRDQRSYCETWLYPEHDLLYEAISEAWPMILEQDPDIKHETFEAWVEDFKRSSLQNSVTFALDWLMNTPLISKGAKHTGYFNADLDADGAIRRSRLLVRSGSSYMPSISLKAFLVANNYNADLRLDVDPKNPGTKRVSELNIIDNNTGELVFQVPVDREGRLVINYAGPQKMFPHVSLSDLLSDGDELTVSQRLFNKKSKTYEIREFKAKKSDFLKDKLFVLGATAVGIYDLRVTPFEENYPGAETHANVIDNLVRRDFLRFHPDEDLKMLIALLVLGVVMTFALNQLGAVASISLTAATLVGISFFDKYFLFQNGIMVSVIFPLLLVMLLYMGLTFYKYFTEERTKKELRGTFQKYVSPAIVDEILKDPSNIELGGRKENITVFFSDVRGFTTISEKLDPRALSDLLNSYLTPMTDLVFENRGTLDKYMGDAVMAFFGAPIPYEAHAEHACRCALQSLVKLTELQKQFAEQGLPNIDIGIGLNTGDCSVGNMGSQTVRNYTVMGDAVNLGSRLEGINKQYGTRIIISEFTYERVKDKFICREIDLVRVKGKILPVKIYELVAEDKAPDQIMRFLELFIEGYNLYHARSFKPAVDTFAQALDINPDDAASTLYIQRCKNFMETPPPKDWDGVFTMTTK